MRHTVAFTPLKRDMPDNILRVGDIVLMEDSYDDPYLVVKLNADDMQMVGLGSANRWANSPFYKGTSLQSRLYDGMPARIIRNYTIEIIETTGNG